MCGIAAHARRLVLAHLVNFSKITVQAHLRVLFFSDLLCTTLDQCLAYCMHPAAH